VPLLKDKAHGVLITGLQLMIEILGNVFNLFIYLILYLMMELIDILPDQKEEYVKLVPTLVRLLRNFISRYHLSINLSNSLCI
jgi:hypothetical protein